jgi:hypothetical protein
MGYLNGTDTDEMGIGTDIAKGILNMKKTIAIVVFILCLAIPKARVAAQGVDTIYTATMQEVQIKDKFLNDTARYRYNQMKYYVKSVLPYVNAATTLFNELDAKLNQPGISKAEKRKYVASKEDLLRTQFEDKVKSLNSTQGALIMKLVARQTGVNIYNILSEFKNPLTAMKWQGWAKLNGANINRKYHPEEEAMLEDIMESLGYSLPSFYNNSTVYKK